MSFLRSDTRPRWFGYLAVAVAALYAWIAAGFRPFTTAEEVMVAIPAVIVLCIAVWQPTRPRLSRSASRARGASVWLTLVALALAWELVAYFSSPRIDHPTLSVIADEIMSVRIGRSAMFLLWLALGWALVRAPRTAAR